MTSQEEKIMRKIKFRAWDKTDKKWMDDEFVMDEPLWGLNADSSRYEWGQFTGLKDAKGIDIYEGDILENNEGKLGEVRWDDWIKNIVVGLPNNEDNWSGELNEFGGWKVIGNIYENPELLGGENE